MNRIIAAIISVALWLANSRAVAATGLEQLLQSRLDLPPDAQLIVTRGEVPPGGSLPRHWHPGEEITYVLEGSVTLWQEGGGETLFEQGELLRIPPRQVHSAAAGAEGVRILTFRVHPAGEPVRVLVEQPMD